MEAGLLTCAQPAVFVTVSLRPVLAIDEILLAVYNKYIRFIK